MGHEVPSPFAKQLSTQLSSSFPIENVDELEAVIDFNLKYIKRHKDDFASLLFLEFGKCAGATITAKTAKTMVARVQKRIYRSTRTSQRSIAIDVEANSEVSISKFKGVIDEFVCQLSASDALIFNLLCLENESISSICQKLGMQKSAVYKRRADLRDRFQHFVS
jgi:hypothetical protein